MEKEWIPNITIGQDYDVTYKDATIHFDALGKMADHFGRNMPVHMHSEYCQIHFILSGKTLFKLDHREYTTKGVAAFYTPAATPHAFLTEPDAPGFVITVHNSHLKEFMDELHICTKDFPLLMPFCVHKHTNISTKDKALWKQLFDLFQILQIEWTERFDYKQKSVETIIRLIILNLLRLSDTSTSNKNTKEDIFLFRKFSFLVEENFLTQKNLGYYSEILNINEPKLNYLCKKIIGNSPKRIINNRVILEAKRLLAYTNKSQAEIAYSLGYIDPSYFSRLFIKATKVSPSNYRKQHGIINNE